MSKWDAKFSYSRPEYWKQRQKGWVKQGIKNATVERYKKLLDDQDGQCAICSRKFSTGDLHLDHDHSNGEIRGLLCSKCNYYLGYFEKEHRLLKAFNYLRKSKQKSA